MTSRSRPLRRGSTLIELLLVIALQVIVVGATATVYVFMIKQCGQSVAAVASINQANGVLDAMATTIRQSMTCATVTSGGQTGLRCTLPNNAVDTDGDGVADVWYPDKFMGSGKAAYTKGTRVWYYQAGSTGAFGTSGTILWRATRSDDANPTASNVDSAWSLYYGGSSRYPMIDSVQFYPGGVCRIGLIVTASASARAPNSSGLSADGADKQTTTLTNVALWRTAFE